ncbi:hypothetical protein [Pseudomonas sp. UBA2684]|uniref:hypothetical protein n=1 Tax=Pseudomonas sp. UBA2684 TaxID=1947311 RepID=UPI000E85EFE7|nr:hypothetical protein [Pseudomonas sp. UBA2684]HBX54543.1 hypothetical protein [Pseudomonas sp.]|tara:strand:- start:19821 stop:20717 length:897 start_codon:yes stop_codon:yes gene_type:complete
MGTCRALILAYLLLAPLAFANPPEAQQTVTWALQNWPGFINSQNDRPVSGRLLDDLRVFTEQLPEYQHRYTLMPISAGFEQLRRGGTLCVVGAFRRQERDLLGHYVGLFFTLPQQLIIRSNDYQHIALAQPEVSLQQLLRRNDLRGALVHGRSYGPLLDPLLSAPQHRANLTRVRSTSSGANLFDMLQHGRIDYLLEYAEVFHYLKQQGQLQQALSLLPLKETETALLSGIYCQRDAAGAQLIRRLDQLARLPQTRTQLIANLHRYLPASTLLPRLDWVERYFEQRQQQSLTNLPTAP